MKRFFGNFRTFRLGDKNSMAIKTSFARWAFAAATSAALLASVSAFAASSVPATLTQQGRILDASGMPVVSKLKFVFTVYDAATGGTSLWTETQNITLDDGYFSAELGSVTPIPDGVFDGSVRYLGVTVGSDAEMSPRQAVTSVPYALKAATADVANSAAFTSLSGIPAPCATGMYLKGYDTTGAAQCGTLPALSCLARYGTTDTATSTEAGCAAGEVMTGGGCYSSGSLTGSYPYVCLNSGNTASSATSPAAGISTDAAIGTPIIILCLADGKWRCESGSVTTTIRAYAMCCKVQ
jgi:hypothetical protein